MQLIGKEIHVVDRAFGLLEHPFLYPFRLQKYKKYLGTYSGGNGNGLVTIEYRFLDWGKFSVDGVEPKGERWKGKYVLIDDICLVGKYRWNVDKNVSMPDVGEHRLYFSEDGTRVQGSWERLTGENAKGKVEWIR